MRTSQAIVVLVLALGAIDLLLFPIQNALPAGLLTSLIAVLILCATWRASRRSRSYARALWVCVSFAALLWFLDFTAGALAMMFGSLKTELSARWPALLLGSFPFTIAFTLPLLLSEDRKKLEIGWLYALDIFQFALIVFSAFLVFFYVPSLHVSNDMERYRQLTVWHLLRDGFLVLGYLYRGSQSRRPDLRRLHFQMAGFMVAYGLSLAIVRAQIMGHWPELPLKFARDLPFLFLLAIAVTWEPSKDARRATEEPDGPKAMLWAQLLALIMPVSVVALASRIPSQDMRVAWIIVSTSFICYAARLFLMQHHQNQTLSSLAALQEKFSKAFKSSPAAISISRLSDGTFIDVNDRWLELTKLTRAEAIGKTSMELGVFENAEDRENLVEALRKYGFVRGMHLNFRLAAHTLDTLVSAEVIKLGGEPLIIASMLDMTEFKNVTQQLQQAQKMELVGSLAGGVAHDFNNLLTVINGYSALALTREPDAEFAEYIRRINEASGKAAALTGQLLAFSRRQVLQPRNISLNTIVAGVEKLLQRTIGENIALVTSFASSLGTVHADPVQMEQVVMNLAVNARDAMPQGGQLLFETKNLDLASPYPGRAFEIPAGRYVMLIVSDTGTGIEPGNLQRIFEPFFTTKGVGAGTGLGLSTVYGIVKQSGGYIWACSDVGVGATFNVCLPRVDSPVDAIQPDQTESEDLRGMGTVLVVDDDPRVCEMTAKILNQYGYEVITANSGEDAERCAQEFGQAIHLLVTDLVMAGTSGRELAQHLKVKRPGLKTIFMSGYSHAALAHGDAVNFCETTLPKPFAPSELARQAKHALSAT
jgi:two-component system, cell cycle sensor histidine kinase and response regulator CckA